jgi:hypothetical protein
LRQEDSNLGSTSFYYKESFSYAYLYIGFFLLILLISLYVGGSEMVTLESVYVRASIFILLLSLFFHKVEKNIFLSIYGRFEKNLGWKVFRRRIW